MKKHFFIQIKYFLIANILLFQFSLLSDNSNKSEEIGTFDNPKLVISLEKKRYQLNEAIKCKLSYFYFIEDKNILVPANEWYADGIGFEDPNATNDRFKESYCRKYFQLISIDTQKEIAYSLKDYLSVKLFFHDKEAAKNGYDLSKLFKINKGKYKVRFVCERVNSVELFLPPPPELFDSIGDPEWNKFSEDEIKKSKEEIEAIRADWERRCREAVNDPRRFEILRASEWIEFEVVE